MKGKNPARRSTKSAEDVEEMLKKLEPYIRRPRVEVVSTMGKWMSDEGIDHLPSADDEAADDADESRAETGYRFFT